MSVASKILEVYHSHIKSKSSMSDGGVVYKNPSSSDIKDLRKDIANDPRSTQWSRDEDRYYARILLDDSTKSAFVWPGHFMIHHDVIEDLQSKGQASKRKREDLLCLEGPIQQGHLVAKVIQGSDDLMKMFPGTGVPITSRKDAHAIVKRFEWAERYNIEFRL